MPGGLVALLDDVAAIAKVAAATIDDVGVAAGKAGTKAAGVVIDAIRCARLAMDRGIGGALNGPSSYFMKSPPIQYTDYEARALTEAFIHDRDLPVDGRSRKRPAAKSRSLPLAGGGKRADGNGHSKRVKKDPAITRRNRAPAADPVAN